MLKNGIVSIFLILISILLIIFSQQTNEGSLYIISLLLSNIIPSLLPFMIIVQFLILFKGIDYLAYFFQSISIKLFNISGYGLIAILSSIIGGFPYSSIIVENLLHENKITQEEGQKICNFIYFPSFSFLYSTLYFFNPIHKKIIATIIIVIYLISFIFLFIFKNKSKIKKIKIYELNNKNIEFKNLYDKMIKNTLLSLSNICITIFIFYNIKNIFKIFLNSNLYFFIGGLLEFSSTALELLSLEQLSLTQILILTFTLSFCGISIFIQSYPYMKKAKINVKQVLAYRLIITLFSIMSIYVIRLFLIH